ncbi:MAG: OmpA family protein [Bacteroidota bacterium]|nr:OmpA family protein [Bacteroidota bacterium]
MKKGSIILLILFCFVLIAQEPTIKIGDKAQSFVLNMPKNSMQGFTMPYMGRIVLLHFYSTSVERSMFYNRPFDRLAKRYKNAIYKGAEGFEVLEIAVQSDKTAWNEAVTKDSLVNVTNGIAVRGYNDELCKKFGITSLPTDIIVDEKGLVIAINPKITIIEEILDEKKNFQPVKSDVVGKIAYSSNSSDVFKFAKLYLFNAYGDSIERGMTDGEGKFLFSEVKLNQDFILKMDNGANITTSDPLAIFNEKGERIVESKNSDNGFIFYVPSKANTKILDPSEDAPLEGKIDQIDVNKHLLFKNAGAELTPKDEFELKGIIEMLKKNDGLFVDVTGHASTKLDSKTALALSQKHANAVKSFLLKKGIPLSHIIVTAKGNSQPLFQCKNPQGCPDEQHMKNQRVEFKVYKD